MKKTVASFVIFSLAFLVLVAFLLATGHASTTGKPKDPLETFEIPTNPYAYRLALPIDGQILEGKYTNIRFWPYGAPELFDETILFCGDVTPLFNGKRGPVVIAFRAQGSRLYKGMACHEILNVFEVPVK